jgi:hypothetical protein
MHPLMEICFELTTKSAAKGTIAIISCVSIAYVATHTQNWYGTTYALLIGIISVIIGTYQMPPFFASTTRSSYMMTSDAISAKGIKAQMPHPILTRVFGKPTHKQVKMVIHKLSANLMAISCPWGHSKVHLGLLQDPAIYLACNGEAFNIPHIEPPAHPVIPAGATTAKHKELCTTNAAACKAWNTHKMVLTITRNQFAVAIGNIYYTVLDDPTKGLIAINLHSLVMHILTIYAQISQPDLDDNMTNFHLGINSGLPLTVFTRKQEKCQVFAANAGVPISDKTMIITGTKHALACGNMTLAWRKWKH